MSKENQSRTRRTFTPELKQQIVQFYHSGKRKCDIMREYDIACFSTSLCSMILWNSYLTDDF